jgi:hypothetical protein
LQKDWKNKERSAVKWSIVVAAAGLSILASPHSGAQDKGTQFGDKELNMTAYIELLRSDIQAQRVAVITQIMRFNEEDATKFWPIYREYQSELLTLNDSKIKVIRDYVENYEHITDQNADEGANTIFDYEAKRVALKKKYYERMKKALSPKTAVRFFQVENQILMLLDLQLSSSLPAIK